MADKQTYKPLNAWCPGQGGDDLNLNLKLPLL